MFGAWPADACPHASANVALLNHAATSLHTCSADLPMCNLQLMVRNVALVCEASHSALQACRPRLLPQTTLRSLFMQVKNRPGQINMMLTWRRQACAQGGLVPPLAASSGKSAHGLQARAICACVRSVVCRSAAWSRDGAHADVTMAPMKVAMEMEGLCLSLGYVAKARKRHGHSIVEGTDVYSGVYSAQLLQHETRHCRCQQPQ